MKRIACLLVTVFLSAAFLYAGDMDKETEMSGVLCNLKCVAQNAGRATCNQNCAEKNGDVVLVDDQGRIFKIENQDKVALHAGKKVKVKCKPVKGKEDTMYIDNLYMGG